MWNLIYLNIINNFKIDDNEKKNLLHRHSVPVRRTNLFVKQLFTIPCFDNSPQRLLLSLEYQIVRK